ncbi:MAG: isoprenylcysteine carboxylmethyltransferase family protein [Thermoplasmata archaeon]|nr:isoprenylcysteine carboxylmethyltransferase family protein [Thermoplasmata archaeon]
MYGVLGDLAAAHTPPIVVGIAFAAAWCVCEYYARRATWRQGAARKPPSTIDRGTYPAIALSLAVGIGFATIAFLTGLGGYFPEWTVGVGVVVMSVGLATRAWALTTLGKFFTMPITLRSDHELVRGGPYRWIRHPAYTGGLLTAIGLPIILGTPAGLIVTLIACLAAYVYRIRIEEAVLVSRFGDHYREYAMTTWRLLPGLY